MLKIEGDKKEYCQIQSEMKEMSVIQKECYINECKSIIKFEN